MAQSETLNVDYASNISEFESAMRKFQLKRIIYRILFRGKGLEFDSYRSYTQDDDAALIDWKATYRANKLLLKQYIEERDIKIIFIIDVGDNMIFGSSHRLKCEYAAEVAVSLAHLVVTSGDKLGFILPKGRVFELAYPKQGLKRFALFADILKRVETYGGPSRMEEAVDFLLAHLDKSFSGIFIVSDFMHLSKGFKKKLNALSSQIETVGIMIRDPLERELPDLDAEVSIENPQTGEKLIVNPSIARSSYGYYVKQREKEVKRLFDETPADFVELVTNKHFPFYLASFMKKRAQEKSSPILLLGA
ncbi:DUF58 domain-containing protein [Candidatus Pacearchaeota archaeon]|nr:DUF58 domain-containing protein [Candidatus Pacearchaeota archaeon]